MQRINMTSGARRDGRAAFDIYVQETAKHELLSPEQERALVGEIAKREAQVWALLLCYAPTAGYVARLIEAAVDAKQLKALRRAATLARHRRTNATRAQLTRAAARLATTLREGDRDRKLLSEVLDELQGVADSASAAERRLGGRLPFSPRSAGFRAFFQRVRDAEAAAAAARHRFVAANLRLVMSVARQYSWSRLSFPDLVQEGNLGLLKAVDRFEAKHGVRFSTYASWWIRHAMQRAVADRSQTVRVPVHVQDARTRLAKVQRQLEARLGRPPTEAELVDDSELGAEKVAFVRERGSSHTVSLDAPSAIDDDAARPRHDSFEITSEEGSSVLDRLCDTAEAKRALAEIAQLEPREGEVLRKRFGLDGERPHTLKEIGDQHNLSRERIRQIEAVALRRLRNRLRGEEDKVVA